MVSSKRFEAGAFLAPRCRWRRLQFFPALFTLALQLLAIPNPS